MGTLQSKAKTQGHASEEGKVKKFKFLSGVTGFLLTLTLVFQLCVRLSSTHELLATFHNALRKQGCPQQGTDSLWTVQIKIV